ncbi:MAG: hypothetical protein ACI9PP_001701 [Halobacteriales archaeon]|jgi:hypothetical protein
MGSSHLNEQAPPSMPDDFYDLLGLPRDATQDDVKRAFRERVRVYHPDLNDDPRAQAQFTALKKAYDTLGDPNERRDYDRMGHGKYVAKRINGLPAQEKWVTESSKSAAKASTRGGSTAAATTSAATDSTTAGGNADQAGAGPQSARTATGGVEAGASSAGASANPTGGSTARSANTTERHQTRRQRATETSLRSRILGMWRIGVGWPLIFATDILYVVAFELFLGANQSAVMTTLEEITAAGTDTGALSEVLFQPATFSVVEFVTASGYVEGWPAAGTLLVLGAVVLPLVYWLVIRQTRGSYSTWNPTRLYVMATLAPLAGLGIAAFGQARVGTDFILLGALPLAAIILLPLSAFVRPWILDTFGRR